MVPCAPVVFLGYRRPDQTSRVFEAIREARPTTLFLVMDGPNPSAPGDSDAVEKTRELLGDIDWPAEVHRLYAESNLGLKVRVTSGLDAVFDEVDEAIIVEDDCLPSPDFFRFASEMLERYRDEPRVGMVSGSSRLRGKAVSDYSYDFSRDVRIWGWATWARTWKGFANSGDLHATWNPHQQSELVPTFPSGSRRRSMKKMLAQASGLDSWALPFVVHCATKGFLNPVPVENLVTNIGLGPSSTHTKFESWVAEVPWGQLTFPLSHPPEVLPNDLLDTTESAEDARFLFAYPLRHPWEAARRVMSFLFLMLKSKVNSRRLKV